MEERFQTFTGLIGKISRNILKIKQVEMAKFDLKSVHVSCLYALHTANRGLTAKDICFLCDEDKASVSRSLEFLEANGYISCDSNAKKRYKNAFTLTTRGLDTAKGVAEKIDGILEQASLGLSEKERVVMYETLTLVSNNLENICNKYGENNGD